MSTNSKQQESMQNPKFRGLFHLASIICIPVILVAFFLPESWIPGIVVSVILLSVIAFLYLKSK
jgi:hypothetical protein